MGRPCQFGGIELVQFTQASTSAPIEQLPRALLAAVEQHRPAVLSGPQGSGKTFALHALAELLAERAIEHCYVDGSAPDARQRVARAARGSVLLIDDFEVASYETLEAVAVHLLDGGTSVGSVTDAEASSEYGSRVTRLYEQMPRLEPLLERTRYFRILPAGDDRIARILYNAGAEQLDAVTVSVIQQLAWGRPGWALDLLQLHESGSLASTPHPRIRRVLANDRHLPSLRQSARMAEATLTPDDVAAAIVLSEIGPRSRNGIMDVIGSAEEARLQGAGLLLAAPGATELFGVPELYAASLHDLVDVDRLADARSRAANHLLAQELFGIPLADHESIFCSRVLSQLDDRLAADPFHAEHHARFQQRVICDLVSFGEGQHARDILLRLGPNAPGISLFSRARLTAILRDARTGLQVLLASGVPRANFDLPSTDPALGFGMLLLQARLAAEAGIPVEADPDTADPDWRDAQLVARRWNDSDPLGADTAELLRIARTHPLQQVALLAEQLVALEASFAGFRYRAFAGAPIEQRITRLTIGASESERDALECATVTQSILRFFASGYAEHDPQLDGLVDSLPAASRHRIWATHLRAARTALVCGDMERSVFEWRNFASTAPRFLPWRLRGIVAAFETPRSAETELLEAGSSYSMQVIGYFAGRLDLLQPEDLVDPAAQIAALTGCDARIGRADVEELPERDTVRAHLRALQTQNPMALLRAADSLESFGFWGPAAYALQEARRIFLRRRATGSVTSTDRRIAALKASIAAQVPWFDPEALPDSPGERLTPRETGAAQLAASGLSNREVAEHMRCSVRTVESHLAQARAKLGLSNRAELKLRFRVDAEQHAR